MNIKIDPRFAVRYVAASQEFAWFTSLRDARAFRDWVEDDEDSPASFEIVSIQTGEVLL